MRRDPASASPKTWPYTSEVMAEVVGDDEVIHLSRLDEC